MYEMLFFCNGKWKCQENVRARARAKEIERAKRVFQPNYVDALHTHLHKHTKTRTHAVYHVYVYVYKIHGCFCRISPTMGIKTQRDTGGDHAKGRERKGTERIACLPRRHYNKRTGSRVTSWANINTKIHTQKGVSGGEWVNKKLCTCGGVL